MTVYQLLKILTILVDKGHARKRVCVQKDTFSHPLEDDGAVILDVKSASIMSFPMIDDDGFAKVLADGTDSCHTACVIKGEV